MIEKTNPGDDSDQTGQLSPKDCFDMLEHAPIGAFTSTPDGRFLSVNPALVRMYGYSTRKELIESINDITSQLYAEPADRNTFKRLLEEQGKLVNYEYRLLRRDGSIYWVSTNVRAVLNEQEKVSYYQGFTTDITRRKQAEDQLLRKFSFLQEIIESSPTPFFSLDRDYRYTSFNKAHALGMKELYGVDIELGHSLYDYQTVPEDRQKSKSNLDRALRGEQFIEEDFAGRQDRSRKYVEVIHNPIRDEYGQVIGVAVFTQDITDRKHAEKELKKNKKFLEAVFDSIQDGICVLDTQLNILGANKQIQNWYDRGMPVEGSKCYIAYQGREVPCNVCPAQRSLSTGKLEMDEVALIQDGTVTGVLQIYAFPMLDDSGTPTGIVEYIRDITERKRAEEKLLESEEKYRSLVEQSGDMMYLHDLEGNFIDVNQAAISHTGYSREELLHMNVFDIHLDQSARNEMRRTWEEWRIGQTKTIETTNWRKNGSTFTAEVNAGRIRFGGKDYILALIRDISWRKQAEEALRRYNETLEQRVTERTRLAETRTRQLQSLTVELIEAEEKERQRIADLLHDDLQQILAAAKMHLQATHYSPVAAPRLAKVEALLKESIEKTRRLSHELSPAIVHHSNLYTALKWLSAQTDEQWGLKVRIEGDADKTHRLKSASMKVFLFRAVKELLFNVSKHAGVDSARVVLTATNKLLDITIIDQGHGMKPEIRDFSNGKSGLGLLSLRERLQAVGGHLLINSAPGQGSAITVRVPLSEANVEATQQMKPDESVFTRVGQDDSSDTQQIRVLFADDHKVMRQGLISMISGHPNLQVVGEAVNGQQALEQARRLRPDVVVMDVLMPEMDGIEATRRIKAEIPDVRVIGLSMYEEDDIIKTMRDAGAEAFLTKTGSSAQLLKAIYGIAT